MERLEMLGELLKCDRDTKWENAIGKKVAVDLFNTGLPHMFKR